MSHTARVLIVGEDVDQDEPLSGRLRVCGCECETTSPEDLSAPKVGGFRPDIVVLNLLADFGKRHPADYVAYARALRAQPGPSLLPVLMVGERTPEHTQSAVAAAERAEIDDVMLSPVNDLQIVERIRALMRLNTMHDELVRRLNTTARYGIDAPTVPPQPKFAQDADVLVVGASAEFSTFENSLSSIATLTGALTPTTALEYLDRRRFEVLIVDCDGDASAVDDFCRQCRADTRLYNTPIIITAEPDIIPASASMFAQGITDLLLKPVEPEELKVRVMALVREVRFRESMRQAYSQALHLSTGDALTGLYTRGFALEHLTGMIREAQERGIPFSVAFGRVANINEINMLHGYAVGDRVIRQVGDLIGLLVRGEDLSVRYGGAKFAIILPDTSEQASKTATRRAIGVINHTEFSIPELFSPVPVVLHMAVTGYRDGDTAEGIVARAAAKT
ncbi:MAG: diguanylate cyclase domain-containing protein [Alphaproteobacteria bacterium]